MKRTDKAREHLIAAAAKVNGDGFDSEVDVLALEQAATGFSAARAIDAQPSGVRETATLGKWERAWHELRRELGRDPSLSELGAMVGRKATAAHAAVKRLITLGKITREVLAETEKKSTRDRTRATTRRTKSTG